MSQHYFKFSFLLFACNLIWGDLEIKGLCFAKIILTHPNPGSDYCTTLFAQFELAKASGFALKANPIPRI